jgi:hypothetical protein
MAEETLPGRGELIQDVTHRAPLNQPSTNDTWTL